MSVSFDRTIKCIWHDWEPGEIANCEDTTLHEVIFDKLEDRYRIRIVLAVDLSNQIIVNAVYNAYPSCLENLLRHIGKLVLKVDANGSTDKASHTINFKDGSWVNL